MACAVLLITPATDIIINWLISTTETGAVPFYQPAWSRTEDVVGRQRLGLVRRAPSGASSRSRMERASLPDTRRRPSRTRSSPGRRTASVLPCCAARWTECSTENSPRWPNTKSQFLDDADLSRSLPRPQPYVALNVEDNRCVGSCGSAGMSAHFFSQIFSQTILETVDAKCFCQLLMYSWFHDIAKQ